MNENLEALQGVQQECIDQMRSLPDTEMKEYQQLGKDLINVNNAIDVEYQRIERGIENELRSRELDLRARELDIREQEAKNEVEIAKIDSKKEKSKSRWALFGTLITVGVGAFITGWQTNRVTQYEEENAITTKAWNGIHKPKF